MITSVNLFISKEFKEEELRDLMSKFCDVLTDEGLASSGNSEDGIASVGVVKLFTGGLDDGDFLEDIFQDSIFAVLPIKSKTGVENE